MTYKDKASYDSTPPCIGAHRESMWGRRHFFAYTYCTYNQMCCILLQGVAVCCRVLQLLHSTGSCRQFVLRATAFCAWTYCTYDYMCCRVLQGVAGCCKTLQIFRRATAFCAWTCCTYNHMYCRVLQCVAGCYSHFTGRRHFVRIYTDLYLFKRDLTKLQRHLKLYI